MKKKYHIAIIEDSNLWHELIKRNLQSDSRFNISLICLWGEDFFTQYKNHHIDLILLDISLPVTNGYEVAKKIKELTPEIPIVVFTSSNNHKDLVWFSSLEIKGYINKVRFNHLSDDLKRILGHFPEKAVYNLKPLNPTDLILLNYVCKGLSNKDIAFHLNTVEKNIEYKLKKICDKLFIPNTKLKIMEFATKFGYW